MTAQPEDDIHMAHALRLARRGLGNVWPNPAVGCVIIHNGRVVGRGWTQPGGRPHAEIVALVQAGSLAQGATAYVTLEPCAHHGQTGPCAEALITAGVARVVTALTDPDPRVTGRGYAMLRSAGITVTESICSAEAEQSQVGFLLRVTQQRPFLTLKLASSFDGRIATASGESQWITGDAARRHAHGFRLTHDAILIGGGTARADRPSLNVRGMGRVRQPVRIIASAGDIPELPTEGPDFGPLWQISGTADQMMKEIAERGITRVFCEGGGQLAANLLKSGLVDQLIGYTAGLAIGEDGLPSIGGLGQANLGSLPRFSLAESRHIGGDLFHRWIRV